MLFKTCIVILLVAVSYTTTMPMENMMCPTDMSEEMCKMEFMKHMENDTMEMHMEMIKMDMNKMMKMYDDMMEEMKADDPMMQMMKDAKQALEKDIEMMDKMKDMTDADKIEEIFAQWYVDVQPMHLEDDVMKETLKKMMKKHGYDDQMIENTTMKMMMKFEEIWSHIYAGLREMDMKKYPKYMEMNDVMKKMKERTHTRDKMPMMMFMLAKMMKFQEMPYMKAMMMFMCADCNE